MTDHRDLIREAEAALDGVPLTADLQIELWDAINAFHEQAKIKRVSYPVMDTVVRVNKEVERLMNLHLSRSIPKLLSALQSASEEAALYKEALNQATYSLDKEQFLYQEQYLSRAREALKRKESP